MSGLKQGNPGYLPIPPVELRAPMPELYRPGTVLPRDLMFNMRLNNEDYILAGSLLTMMWNGYLKPSAEGCVFDRRTLDTIRPEVIAELERRGYRFRELPVTIISGPRAPLHFAPQADPMAHPADMNSPEGRRVQALRAAPREAGIDCDELPLPDPVADIEYAAGPDPFALQEVA